MFPVSLVGWVYVTIVKNNTSRVVRERGHCYWSGLFSVTLVGWVYVTMVKKNTSRVGREEVSLPLVGIVVPSVTLAGWVVYVTMAKNNTSRVASDERSILRVGIAPRSSLVGWVLCHDGEEQH